MKKLSETAMAIILGMGIVMFFAVIMALPVMWLWDWLMPEIFGLKEITFWQALGLNFLFSILFKASSTSK